MDWLCLLDKPVDAAECCSAEMAPPLDTLRCPRDMTEMDRTTEAIENELKRLEEKIGEVKRRLPAHSVKPPIMMELLELEDQRDALLKILIEV
jgi:hypothetical protein